MTDFYAAQHEAHRRMVLEEERRKVNRLSHRRPVVHDPCGLDHGCPICEGGLFVCADCGAAEAQLEEVHCVDRVKADWQAALAQAVRTIVPDWDEDISPAIAQARLTQLIRELEDRWIRAGAAVAQFGVSTPMNIREEWRPEDLSAAIDEIGRRMLEAERKLRDWREGDREGVSAHMRAFREQAQRAEARIAVLETSLRIAQQRETRERRMRMEADERISQAKIALTGLHVEAPLTRPGFACPHCGHRHPPDGGCV